MHRVTDRDELKQALSLSIFGEVALDVDEWLAEPLNVALADEGNIGLFGIYTLGVYTGHYFFKARGKKARDLSILMLSEIFDENKYDCKIVRGLTPTEHLGAVWLTRHLGFKEYDRVDTWVGPCIVFMMTKEEFKALYQGKHNG